MAKKKAKKGRRRSNCNLNKKTCRITRRYGYGNKRRFISGSTCSKGLQNRAIGCVQKKSKYLQTGYKYKQPKAITAYLRQLDNAPLMPKKRRKKVAKKSTWGAGFKKPAKY